MTGTAADGALGPGSPDALREARRVKAFDFAADAGKQLLVLSTGVLALTATFAKDLIGREQFRGGLAVLLVAAWVLFLLSILCGLWFLFALVGSLGQKRPDDDPPSVYDTNATLPSLLQMGTFLLAMVCTAVVGVIGLT